MLAAELACIVVCCVSSAPAQSVPLHYPRQKTIAVRSETVLAGIDLYSTSAERVIDILGKPTRINRAAGNEFEWVTDDCRLSIVFWTVGQID